jgi:DNA polymerase III epsilon subunit-like protein
MKVAYLDLETTGTDPKLNEMIQFAAIIEIDGEVVEEVNIKCQPTRWENVSKEALEVTGLTLEGLKTLPQPKEAFTQIKALFDRHIDKFNKTDKFYPAGHNVTFDLDFLQAFWKQHGDIYGTGSYQNWQCLDSRILANFLRFKKKIEVENNKLETLCKFYDIELKAHDALNDIRATRTLIKKMMESI